MALDNKKLKTTLWSGSVMAGFRTITVLLLLVVITMVCVWKPWMPWGMGSGRTISVIGTATIKATPDQYTFSPSYSFSNDDKKAALKALTAKSDGIVAKLKSLGVASKDIQTNASGYENNGYYMPMYVGGNTYTLSITVITTDAQLAQKVQDYLITTNPSGAVTPSVDFTTAKNDELQNRARDKAEQDARAQADQSAKNLGFSVGAVKAVTDQSGGSGGPFPMVYGSSNALDSAMPKSLTLQPGQNDYSYSVTVIYYIQ